MMIEAFRNKAGRYVLLGLERGRVRYRFTSNATGATVEAAVLEVIWARMASRAQLEPGPMGPIGAGRQRGPEAGSQPGS